MADVNDAIHANVIMTSCDNFNFSGLLANAIGDQVRQEVEGTVEGDELDDLEAAIFQPVVQVDATQSPFGPSFGSPPSLCLGSPTPMPCGESTPGRQPISSLTHAPL